jgi:hypothetical protein
MFRSYRSIAPQRLRYYAEVSGRVFLRQWQGMLLLGLLVIGQATTILMIPAALLAQMVRTGSATGLVALVLLGALWVLPQRRHIRGGAFSPYAATLPLDAVTRALLDLTVLLLADALLLLEVVLALTSGGAGMLPGLLGALGLVLAAQMAVLHAPLPDPRRIVRTMPFPPPLRLQLHALAEHPVSIGMRGLVAIGLAALAAAIATAFHFDPRAVPVAIGALALIGFVLADFYRLLRDAHAPMRAYLATLPLAPHHLLLRDVLTVLLAGAVPFLMLAVWFGVFDPGSLFAFAGLAVGYALLLAALRLPVLRGGRLAAMLAAILAAGWAGGAIAMVLR